MVSTHGEMVMEYCVHVCGKACEAIGMPLEQLVGEYIDKASVVACGQAT